MNQARSRSTGDLSLSLFWIGLGLFFLWFARDIPEASFTSEGDPGPRAFPQWLGLALVIGGIWELIRQRRAKTSPQEHSSFSTLPKLSDNHDQSLDAREGESNSRAVQTEDEKPQALQPLNALVVLVGVTLYIVVLPWIGFSIATLILVTSLLRFLGSRWWLSSTVALCLLVLIQLLFGYAFNVPLPTNHWGLVLPGGFLF